MDASLVVNHVKELAVGVGLAIAIPILWKIAPKLIGKAIGPVNAAAILILRKTKPLWKGHEKQLKDAIEELGDELQADVDVVSQESKPPEQPKA